MKFIFMAYSSPVTSFLFSALIAHNCFPLSFYYLLTTLLIFSFNLSCFTGVYHPFTKPFFTSLVSTFFSISSAYFAFSSYFLLILYLLLLRDLSSFSASFFLSFYSSSLFLNSYFSSAVPLFLLVLRFPHLNSSAAIQTQQTAVQ